MKTTTEKAFAKINLYLDVTSTRPDGFHDIKSIMHAVTLADDLTFTLREGSCGGHTLRVIGDESIPADSDNLVLRAVTAFEARSPLGGSLDITLEKHIPSAAGLAGGSSDAAATLRALNRLSGNKLSDHELFEIASSLGSDVPFCLSENAAVCLGRGEKMESIPPLKNLYLVIVKPDESVSTPRAYRLLDEAYDLFRGEREDSGRKASFSSILSGNTEHLFNIFEEVIFPISPKAKMAKEMLVSLGASSALMSGSGSSVFGIFTSRDEALSVEERIKKDFPFACYAKGKC